MIRLALLYFPSEKRSYVRPINTIEDLPEPRSVTDFEEHKLYSVKWDVLKREDSDTVEKAFHAKILLLATSPESLVSQAKAAKPPIRLPKEFMSDYSKTQPRKPTMADDKRSRDSSRRDSKHAKKATVTATKESTKARMETLAMKKPCVVDGTTTVVQSATSVNSTSVDVPKECERDVLLDDIQSTTPNVTNANSGINDLDGRNSKRRSRESDGSEGPPKKRRSSRRHDSTDSEESSATDALKGTIKKLEGEISTLMDKLAVEKKKVRAQETELNSMRLRLEAWKKAHAQLSHVAQTEAATPKPFEMHESVPGSPDTPIVDKFQQFISDGAGAEHPDRISVTRKALKFDDETPDIESPIANDFDYHSGFKASGKSMTDSKTQDLTTPSSAEEAASPDNIGSSGSKASGTSMTDSKTQDLTTPSSAEKAACVDNIGSSGSKASDDAKNADKKMKNKKYSSLNSLGPNERPNKDLAPMILRAMKGEEPLQANAKGQVLIGNNIYIKKSVWDRVSSPKTKHSIAIKDLTEEIFSLEGCARISLCGGKSPKTSADDAQKEAAPAGAIEAIFGIFRARKMFEGLLSEQHLDEAVVHEGEKYVREKFIDSAKKLKRLAEKEAREGCGKVAET